MGAAYYSLCIYIIFRDVDKSELWAPPNRITEVSQGWGMGQNQGGGGGAQMGAIHNLLKGSITISTSLWKTKMSSSSEHSSIED